MASASDGDFDILRVILVSITFCLTIVLLPFIVCSSVGGVAIFFPLQNYAKRSLLGVILSVVATLCGLYVLFHLMSITLTFLYWDFIVKSLASFLPAKTVARIDGWWPQYTHAINSLSLVGSLGVGLWGHRKSETKMAKPTSSFSQPSTLDGWLKANLFWIDPATIALLAFGLILFLGRYVDDHVMAVAAAWPALLGLRKWRVPSHDFGSSPFAPRVGYEKYFVGKEELCLGQISRSQPLCLNWVDVVNHIGILGQTGAGKSVLLQSVYIHRIVNGKGILIFDLKGDRDVFELVSQLSESVGRSQDLMVVDLGNPLSSFGYNPLLRGLASELKDKIIGAFEWSEPYYKKLSEAVLLDLFSGLVCLRDELKERVDLGLAYNLLRDADELERLAAKLSDAGHQTESKKILSLLSIIRDKDLSKGLQGLLSDLKDLVDSSYGEILAKPNGLDMLEVVRQGKIVLLRLDQRFGAGAIRLARMCLSDIRNVSGTLSSQVSRAARPEFVVVIDEFADIVSSSDLGRLFSSLLNRARGAGIGIIFAHQSLGDFPDANVARQVIDNPGTLISFVQKDPDTCEMLANIVGTKEEWRYSEQTENQWGASVGTGLGNRRLSHEYIYHPNVFKNLNVGEAVYIAKKPSRHTRFSVSLWRVP